MDQTSTTSVNTSFFDLRDGIDKVEKSFVAENTTDVYMGKLITFMIWLYDKRSEYLEDGIYDLLRVEDDKDKVEAAKPKKKSKYVRKTIVYNEEDDLKRKHLRALCKELLSNMKPSFEGAPHNCPIRIDGEVQLNYYVVRDYMMLKKNVLLLEKERTETYIKQTKKTGEVDDGHMMDGKVKVLTQQSLSSYEGVRSALGYIYKVTRVRMPIDMTEKLKVFIAGKRRSTLAEKQHLGLELTAGKKPMTRETYELLAKYFFFSGEKEHVFGHLFLVLDWSLMKRVENCVNAKINHIYFEHDALVFRFAKSKGHQRGEKHIGPWHVYANPEKPWICPVLAMARYLVCHTDVLIGNAPLFEGSNQYSRYSKMFERTCQVLDKELKSLGYSFGDLGTHSCRKGVATFIASGCTVSPPIAPICIRAGWKIGGQKDTYIFHEAAGDQYVGRCASCLDQLSKEFSVSPPYFDFSHLNDNEKIGKKKILDDFLLSRLPEMDEMRPKTFHLVKMCFASLCYHFEYLKRNMHQACVLRSAPLFRDIPKVLRDLAVIKFPWNKTIETPTLSGIPPHVINLAHMEKLNIELQELRTNIKTDLETLMDQRGFSSTGFNTQTVIDAITKQQKEYFDNMMKNLNANIAKPGSNDNNEMQVYTLIEEDIDDEIDNSTDLTFEEDIAKRKEIHLKSKDNVKKRVFTVGLHHGVLTPLPVNFQWPRMNAQQLCINWLVGNVDESIPPYATFNHIFLSHDKKLYGQWGAMFSFMKYVECVARKHRVWQKKIIRLDV